MTEDGCCAAVTALSCMAMLLALLVLAATFVFDILVGS